MFTTFSKQNSRTRRKVAAGFKGEGTNQNYISYSWGTLKDKEPRTASLEKHYASRTKSILHQVDTLGLRYGRKVGSKSLYKILTNIRRNNKQMASLYQKEA